MKNKLISIEPNYNCNHIEGLSVIYADERFLDQLVDDARTPIKFAALKLAEVRCGVGRQALRNNKCAHFF